MREISRSDIHTRNTIVRQPAGQDPKKTVDGIFCSKLVTMLECITMV